MKNKLIALFTVLLMLFQIVAPVMAMEVQPNFEQESTGGVRTAVDDLFVMSNSVALNEHEQNKNEQSKGIGAGTTYDVNAAVSYAIEHALDTPQYSGGDCANFISHCLAAGGITIPNYSYYSSSTYSYQNCSGTLGAYTNPYIASAAQLLYLSEYYEVITKPSFSQIELGDIVFTNGAGGDPDGHVVIITGFNGSTPLYCGHTNARKNYPLGSGAANYVVKMCGSSISDTDRWNPDNYPVPTRTLYINMSGDDVKWLQAVLYQLGYYAQSLGLDGEFGQGTRTAVINFQNDHGLTADAEVGPATRAKLIECWEELNTPTPTNAWVNASPGTIMLGQSVHITCGADYAEWYYTNIYFNGSNVYNCDTNDYYYTPTEAGTYEVHASGQNGRGGSDVARCEFTVLDTTITKPIISTSQNKYAYNSEVEINWTVDSNVSWYWLSIWDGSNPIVSINPGYSGTYIYKAETPGQIEVRLSAHNDYNDVYADNYYFMVLPETPVLNVNPGTDKTNTAFYWNRCVGAESYDLRIFNADGSSYLNWWTISDNCKLINLPAGSYYATVTAGNGLEGCWAFSSQTEVFTVDSLCNVRMIDSVEYDGHTYALLNHKVPDWHDAEMICEKLGGHLATITSEDEQEVIFNLIKECGDHVWLGASDEEDEGTWKWVTGEDCSYTNWNEDQPDNHNSDTLAGEDYMHMYSTNGKWNDITNVGYCPYILIELEYNGETYDGLPIASTEYNGHTYTLYSDIVLNWHDAEEFCESNGGTLATITSEEEQQVVFELVADNFDFGTLWLGATDEESEGNWEWVTGEPFDYTNWDEGEPSNSNEREHYMHLYINYGDYTGKWNDTIEIQPCYFILETVNTYTVTYLDGITDEVISTATVEHGADADFPTSPEHEGYTFTGWDSDGKNINADTTITALYEINTYTITYLDGVTGEIIATATVEHGTDADFPTPPEHEGYTFTGWDSDGKNITADTTITALYEESTSVILGDANGDGVINGKDVTLIRRYITGGYDVEVILEAADINGDGVINGKDITLLRRLIVGGYGDVA